jgi:hypothetical protein
VIDKIYIIPCGNFKIIFEILPDKNNEEIYDGVSEAREAD